MNIAYKIIFFEVAKVQQIVKISDFYFNFFK